MPLNFVEIEKPKPTVDIFKPNPNTRPWELEGEVLPALIQRCGDPKEGRIALPMVEQYLNKHVMIFDRDVLREMFAEADFKKEGSLDLRALRSIFSARYPKRHFHREWRQLGAMLLGVSELILCEDIKNPKYIEDLTESVWDKPPPALPKVRKPKTKSQEQGKQAPALAATTNTSTSTASTAEGPKKTAPVTARPLQTSTDLTTTGRSTFSDVQRIDAFNKAMGLPPPDNAPPRAMMLMRPSKMSVKAMAASMPPSAIAIPSPALQTLRGSVVSKHSAKVPFSNTTKPLTTSSFDQKKSLGEPVDLTATLNRVEPKRPDKTLHDADYVTWGDYASRTCRTAPSNWFNHHPAAPAPLEDAS